jgi:hypothetical protein
MRQETPKTHCSACYGAGTRVEVHRSRYELERVLSKHGANEVLFVEADAKAAIQFAMRGRYVQLALPLPDPRDARFTHTPSGRVRATTARERAYDQALRERWRSLIVAVRGKLQSVESGISTFEQEFDQFLVPQFAAETEPRTRRAPRAVNWLLGGSHTIAIALVAAFLVPASAVGAFALPTGVVGQIAAPFRSSVADDSSSGERASGVALARGDWSPSSGDADASSSDAGRLLTPRSEPAGSGVAAPRPEAAPPAPPSEPADVTPVDGTPAAVVGDPPPSPGPPASAGAAADTGPPVSDGGFVSVPPPATPPPGESVSQQGDSGAAPEGPQPSELPAEDSSSPTPPDVPPDTAPPPDTTPPPDAGGTTPPGDGNGNGLGNGSGQGNGQGSANGNGNGNGNGWGQGTGQGQGNGQGNGKGNGGK